jgi:hypothetical protein
MAVTDPRAAGARVSTHPKGLEGNQMQFCIGDRVRQGLHIATVTDVGTVLIQVKTTTGISRMVCPWELVRMRPARALGPHSAAPL